MTDDEFEGKLKKLLRLSRRTFWLDVLNVISALIVAGCVLFLMYVLLLSDG